MPTKTIVVENTKPPQEGKKMGRVYDTEGNFYSEWPDKLPEYTPGASVHIEYEESEFRGKMYAKIQGRKVLSGDAAAAVRSSHAPVGSHDEGEDMFVRGVMCSAYQGAGGVPDYAILLNDCEKLRHAWRDSKKLMQRVAEEQAKEVQREEIKDAVKGDEIPF